MTNEQIETRPDPWHQRVLMEAHGYLGMIGMLFAWVILLGPVGMLGWQSLEWLRNGYWDRWPIERALVKIGIAEPQTTWGGVQQIIHFLFGMPTWFALGFLALAGVMLTGWLILQIDKHHTADARVHYEMNGQKQVRLCRSVIKGSETDAIRFMWRVFPDGGFKVIRIEWLPRT